MAGTDARLLMHLARESGGAVFSVVSEAQIAKASTAHRHRPWQLSDVEIEGGSDLLLAGRPRAIYPGHELLLVGRGVPRDGAAIALTLQRGDEKKVVTTTTTHTLDSELAERAYGQVAVGQLESLGEATQEVSTAYARHFRVTGQTCSRLMLESEADYQRFNIKPEEDAFVVKSQPAAAIVQRALAKKFHAVLGDRDGGGKRVNSWPPLRHG